MCISQSRYQLSFAPNPQSLTFVFLRFPANLKVLNVTHTLYIHVCKHMYLYIYSYYVDK